MKNLIKVVGFAVTEAGDYWVAWCEKCPRGWRVAKPRSGKVADLPGGATIHLRNHAAMHASELPFQHRDTRRAKPKPARVRVKAA